jgi:TRAP-type mannitol/chloroaromatic compound transport system permease small subunit
MMAGAYTLSRNGHVRADFAYRLLRPRQQAALDLTLYLLFFLPAMIGMIIYGWDFFVQSYWQNEASSVSPDGPLIWPFKFIIPLAAATVLLQGLAEIARCVVCLREGDFPSKAHDVREMEEIALELARAKQRAGQGHAQGSGQ